MMALLFFLSPTPTPTLLLLLLILCSNSITATFVTSSSSSSTTTTSTTETRQLKLQLYMSSPSNNKVIDSHLHIWATHDESQSAYPYSSPSQTPPSNLINKASPQCLLEQMKHANVHGSLIVQPINHLYDHSYVIHAITNHPDKFKGMMLFDPTSSSTIALERLEELVLKGFVGVRFNPYLWKESQSESTNNNNDNDDNDDNNHNLKYMSNGSGLQVYKRCGELGIPVGIMCFKGLDLHYDDIIDLLQKSPQTILILDHFGFTFLSDNDDDGDGDKDENDKLFNLLLSLAKYDNVIVKISALFRIAGPGNDLYPYHRVKEERFDVLLETFGKDRLMFGTDFPFVLEQHGAYKGTVDLVKQWTDGNVDVQNAIMYENAEHLFGVWGSQ